MRQTTIQRTWLDMTIQSFPSLVESYKKDLGLPKLIAPEYVSPDTAVFYKRKSTGDYERIVAPCGVQGLYTAMLKGWLMVAPDKVETPFETPASSALSAATILSVCFCNSAGSSAPRVVGKPPPIPSPLK